MQHFTKPSKTCLRLYAGDIQINYGMIVHRNTILCFVFRLWHHIFYTKHGTIINKIGHLSIPALVHNYMTKISSDSFQMHCLNKYSFFSTPVIKALWTKYFMTYHSIYKLHQTISNQTLKMTYKKNAL